MLVADFPIRVSGLEDAKGSSWERVRAVEPDKMGTDDRAAPHQALRPLFEQHYPLFAARTYRLDEPSAEGKLLYKRRWGTRGNAAEIRIAS